LVDLLVIKNLGQSLCLVTRNIWIFICREIYLFGGNNNFYKLNF